MKRTANTPPKIKYRISFKFRLSHDAAAVGRVECHVTTGSKIVRFGVDGTQKMERHLWREERFADKTIRTRAANDAIQKVEDGVTEMFEEWERLSDADRPTPSEMIARIRERYTKDKPVPLVKGTIRKEERTHHLPALANVPRSIFAEKYYEWASKRTTAIAKNGRVVHIKQGTRTTNLASLEQFRAFEMWETNGRGYRMSDLHKVNEDRMRKKLAEYAKLQRWSPSTIGRVGKDINVFLRATEEGSVKSQRYMRFATVGVENQADTEIYLTDEDKAQLRALVLSPLDPLYKVRDVFTVALYTGLRFSDYQKFDCRLYRSKHQDILQEKTGGQVRAYHWNEVREVMKRYAKGDGRLPRYSSASNFNALLKRLFRKAGLDRRVRKRGVANVHLYDAISSHVARYTCGTWLLKNGHDHVLVSRAIGHKTLTTLLRYYDKRTGEDEANAMGVPEYIETGDEGDE